jgi:uncharacterized membrane protein YccF (DUF307 family)
VYMSFLCIFINFCSSIVLRFSLQKVLQIIVYLQVGSRTNFMHVVVSKSCRISIIQSPVVLNHARLVVI